MLNNQSILQNFALVDEVDEQGAEIISGGGFYEYDRYRGDYRGRRRSSWRFEKRYVSRYDDRGCWDRYGCC